MSSWPEKPGHRDKAATAYIDRYFQRYPASSATWMKRVSWPRRAMSRTVFGRRLCSRDQLAERPARLLPVAERAAINAPMR
jgi:DNA polymerase I-like protein with 3'-5' exonuclease and polymerase domains